MAHGNRWRSWEGLNHDILAIIFTKMKIPADEMMRTVPFVCRGWRKGVATSECWPEIDIMKWSQRAPHVDAINVAVRNLVHLSSHKLQRLSACRMGNKAFKITAAFGSRLSVLEIPMSKVNDSSLEIFSRSLTALKVLDISYCYKVTFKGIEAVGKNCTSLIHFRRNKFSPIRSFVYEVTNAIDEHEALAVANTMLGLEQLELEFGFFSDHGLDAILNNCKKLSSLNIGGCRYVKLDGNVGMKYHALKFSKEPSSRI